MGASWTVVRDVTKVHVYPYVPHFNDDGIELKQSGAAEPLGKACLRQASFLSFQDLMDMMVHLSLHEVGGHPNTRDGLLRVLSEYFAPGDVSFKDAVLAHTPTKESLELLVHDPLFDMTWDEMDDDDKTELADVKKAINRRRSQAGGKKRKLAGKPRFRPKAKAKMSPPNVAPVVADVAHPGASSSDGAVPILQPNICVGGLAPPSLRGDYKYIVFAGGHIVFSVRLRKMNAHCYHEDHIKSDTRQRQTCHMDRSVPEEPDFLAQRVKGRPLGLLALWLKDPLASDGKQAHHEHKSVYASLEFQEERRLARAELWAARHQNTDIEILFSIEAAVPDALLAGVESPLWEPSCVF